VTVFIVKLRAGEKTTEEERAPADKERAHCPLAHKPMRGRCDASSCGSFIGRSYAADLYEKTAARAGAKMPGPCTLKVQPREMQTPENRFADYAGDFSRCI
jgi:hypothetical protein